MMISTSAEQILEKVDQKNINEQPKNQIGIFQTKLPNIFCQVRGFYVCQFEAIM